MEKSTLKLGNGSQVAVIGGGPAGSFFSYFLLDMASRVGMNLQVDIYEIKDFARTGAAACNHCGGIISESLVQILSAEGINLPSKVVRRGIDAYVLHMDVGSVRIETPLSEKRIAAVYRGSGPSGANALDWKSFDGYLQQLTMDQGARIVKDRVVDITFKDALPCVTTRGQVSKSYDLVVGAGGINATASALFEKMGFGYKLPITTKTFISEFHLGAPLVRECFGNAMHVFLMNVPRLDFAAFIPKGDYVTLALLGHKIDKTLVDTFLNTPEVRNCFPPDVDLAEKKACQCYPKINIRAAVQPFKDRVVLIGDASAARLFKDGIGAAYVTAKAAATTAVFHGISTQDFRQHFQPVCRSISFDNIIGKIIFACTHQVQKRKFIKRGLFRQVSREQQVRNSKKRLSMVLWDTFTGSAPYRDIFWRTWKPAFFLPLIWHIFKGMLSFSGGSRRLFGAGGTDDMGKLYQDGEEVIRENEPGECMYVIQEGTVEVFKVSDGKSVHLADLGEGNFFGEMALFEREVRSSSVRAKGPVRVLTVDKGTLLRRIQSDPSMAFRIVEKMSSRIRAMNSLLSRIKASDRRNWDTRVDRK